MDIDPYRRTATPESHVNTGAEFGTRLGLQPVLVIAAKGMLGPGVDAGCYAAYEDGTVITACNPDDCISNGEVMGSAVELSPIVTAFASGQFRHCRPISRNGLALGHRLSKQETSGQVGDIIAIRANEMMLVRVVVPKAPDSDQRSKIPRILSFAVHDQGVPADTVLETAARAFPGLKEPLEDALAKQGPVHDVSLGSDDIVYKRNFVDATERGGRNAGAFCGRDPEFMFSGKWKNPGPNGQVDAGQFADAREVFDVLWSGWRISRLCNPAVTIDDYRRRASDVLVANMVNKLPLGGLVGRPKIPVPMQIFLKIVNTFAEQASKMDHQPTEWDWDRYLDEHGLGRSRLRIVEGSDASERPYVDDPKLDVLRLEDETATLVSPPNRVPSSLGVGETAAPDPLEEHVLTAKRSGGRHAERPSRWRRAAAVVIGLGVGAAAVTAAIAGTSHGSSHADTYGQASAQTLPHTSSHDWSTSSPTILHSDGDSRHAEAPAPASTPNYTEVKLGVYEPGPAGIGTVSGWALKGLMEQGIADPTQGQIQVATYDIIKASHLPTSNQGLQDLSPGATVFIPHDLAKTVEAQATYAQAA